MSQKVLFYQEDRPKTADGLWMHKDSDGNMKLDYVGNNSVYPIGYVSSEAGGGSASDGYKPYLKINPSSEYETAPPFGLTFTSAADAAQSLGISEQDFLKICSAQMPMLVDINGGLLKLSVYEEDSGEQDFGYVISDSEYVGDLANLYIYAFKESSEADDSTKQYKVFLYINENPIG